MEENTLEVPIFCIPGNEDLPLPAYQTDGAAAMDLHAAVGEPTVVAPGAIVVVPCGFAIAVPIGHEAQVRSRSGLASKQGIAVINAPGTIDSDYRGEVKVALINHGSDPVTIERGMRIAQLLVTVVSRVQWIKTEALPETKRATGGFGHTGTSSG
jgi:dUTP pyrophosphatase